MACDVYDCGQPMRCYVCHHPAVVTVYGIPGSELHYCEKHRPASTRLMVQSPPDPARAAVLADARRVLEQIAAEEPLASDDCVSWCLYCDGKCPDPWDFAGEGNPLQHDRDCLWLAVRDVMARWAALDREANVHVDSPSERTTATQTNESSE